MLARLARAQALFCHIGVPRPCENAHPPGHPPGPISLRKGPRGGAFSCKRASPVGLCLGSQGVPGGWAFSYGLGFPLPAFVHGALLTSMRANMPCECTMLPPTVGSMFFSNGPLVGAFVFLWIGSRVEASRPRSALAWGQKCFVQTGGGTVL